MNMSTIQISEPTKGKEIAWQDTIGDVIRANHDPDRKNLMLTIMKLINQFVDDLKISLDLISSDEKVTIAKYIMRYYRDLSLADVKKAFQLTIVKGIQYVEMDYNHYNRFGAEYVCRILSAYREYKRIYKLKNPPPKPELKELTMSEDARINTIKKIAETTYADYKNHGRFHLINVDSVFELLKNEGMVDDYPNLEPIYIGKLRAKDKSAASKDKPQISTIGQLLLQNKVMNPTESEIIKAKKLYLKDRFDFWIKAGNETLFNHKKNQS